MRGGKEVSLERQGCNKLKTHTVRACCCVVDLLASPGRGRKITSPGQNSGREQVSSIQEEQIFHTFFLAAVAVAGVEA